MLSLELTNFRPPPSPLFEPGELSSWPFYRVGIAEFIVTFLFLYVTVLTVMGVARAPNKCASVGIQGIAWAFGGMIFALVYCTAGISGSTNGIGLETARVLVLRGVHVIMAVRNVKAGEKVKAELLEKVQDAKIDVMALDLNSQASVRKFAEEYISLSLPLNILINNAGINSPLFTLSEDGIEQQFAVNHLGPFLLTNLLLDTMKKTASESGIEGRIVSVGSAMHAYGYKEGIRFDKINDEASYNPSDAYGQSKLCTMLHTLELSRRLKVKRKELILLQIRYILALSVQIL